VEEPTALGLGPSLATGLLSLCLSHDQAVRRVLQPTGLYKNIRSLDFLWQYCDLSYKLK
jgi:hypothetical protein